MKNRINLLEVIILGIKAFKAGRLQCQLKAKYPGFDFCLILGVYLLHHAMILP